MRLFEKVSYIPNGILPERKTQNYELNKHYKTSLILR